MSDNWLYFVEGVYQTGQSASDPLFGLQSTEDLEAWAARLQFTYVFRDENDSRFQAEVLIASGDPDRRSTTDTVAGNFPGTDDNAFNALGYAFTGVAFAPTLSNLVSIRAGGATFPWRSSEDYHDLQVGVDAILSFKESRTGGIDEPTNDEFFLGTEFDVYANWRITSDLSITSRYGLFLPGPAIPDPDYARHFIYVGVTLAF
ncbi:MAG: alginate export family protein [Phycisphaerales bacterium]